MKLSKMCKARIKRMSSAEKKQLVKSAAFLADCEVISSARYIAVARTCNGSKY